MKKNDFTGKFIVFDGLDGSGLTTQAGLLADYLNQKKTNNSLGFAGAFLTKEPTKNLIGGLINAQLSRHWTSSQECLQLLFSADRSFHLEKEIIPLLQRGVTVICDRYLYSTLAFGSLGLDFDWLLNIQNNFLEPDAVFFLKVSPEMCAKRIDENRFSVTLFEKIEIAKKVWLNYERLAKMFDNIYIIDGEQPVETIHQEIRDIVDKIY